MHKKFQKKNNVHIKQKNFGKAKNRVIFLVIFKVKNFQS